MATTADGLPYPVGTDKVVDGDDSIKALADALQARGLGKRWLADKQNITTGSTGIAIVSFPVAFTTQPIVVGLIQWTYGAVFVMVDASQNGGVVGSAFYLKLQRPDGSTVNSAPCLISYIAVGGN
jgi:hypothetical protein